MKKMTHSKSVRTILLTIVALISLNLTGFSQEEEKQVKVLISTEYGDMTAVLYNETPLHRDNFVKITKEGWYDDSPFHRIIEGFMIQGGMNADGRRDPGYTVPAEFDTKLFHKKGALCAARTNNPEKASSGSQFYIVQGKSYPADQIPMMGQRSGITYTEEQIEAYSTIGGTPQLDGAYTVYGEVIEGLEVIDKLAAVETAPGDKPVKDVTMKITIIEEN
ncbi:MAG: peptidylprolyl isomerase [Bacteroidetes bacterium]|nr:MAG: peptidylprolyl isomerase [Bacteroidota bacterium]